MCQTPAYAPTARKIQKATDLTDSSSRRESNNYLFENIDESLLKENEELILKTYK